MKFSSILLILLFSISSAFSGVNLKNGNFYVSYTDLIVPGGGHDLKIVRTYNSKSAEKGWFGFGWGSDYETFLTVSADGSIVVHENGAGALTRFTPRESVNADAATEKIIAAMRKKTTVSEKSASTLRKQLRNDAELRQAYARRFAVKANLAVGTELYSNTRGLQRVKVVKNGFQRVFNDGKVESFGKDGKLKKIKDKNGYYVEVFYEKGQVKSIKDSQAKQIFFSWYSNGKVEKVWSAGDKVASYQYKKDNLSRSKDVVGNVFVYDYDTNHNMTSVTYKDGSKMLVEYKNKTQFVSKVVDKNKVETTYKYDSNPKNPDHHYWTLVGKKTPNGKKVSNRYEYETKVRPDGSQYTYRILTEINGVRTETVYSECCGLPLKISRGDHTTQFEYNKKGLLVKKTSTKGEFISLEYHKKFNKISKVSTNRGITTYDYDKKGNLSKAESSKGTSVLLIYDRRGRITKMIDNNKKTKKRRTLTFKYNALGKPVEIAMKNTGKIFVAYDNYGDIKKVESKAGHKMALQVTQAFQSLLAIIKPAGVNLNM
jgi:YD repeat-containing protein